VTATLRTLSFVTATLVIAVSASAQDSQIGKFTADVAVPESPAFTVLGITPETVARPSTPQQLATALVNGIDRNGNFQTGIAIDTQPYMLAYGHKLSWTQYRDRYMARFFARTQVSLGTTKGATEDDKSGRVAVGLRFTLWNLGDPFRDEDTAKCLDAAAQAVLTPAALGPVPPPGAPAAQIEAYQKKKMALLEPEETKCRDSQDERVRRTMWNNSSMVVGAAWSGISPTANAGSLESNGAGYWTSITYGFERVPGLEDTSQLVFHYRHRDREQVPKPGTTEEFFTQDSDFVATQGRFGSADVNGSFEWVFVRAEPAGGTVDWSTRWSVALERRVTGNTWLQMSFGGERSRADGRNQNFVLSSFNWSLNQK